MTERQAEAEGDAAFAVTLLVRARDAGTLKQPAQRAWLRSEPALGPLRSRDDFKDLLAALEEPKPPAEK